MFELVSTGGLSAILTAKADLRDRQRSAKCRPQGLPRLPVPGFTLSLVSLLEVGGPPPKGPEGSERRTLSCNINLSR
jgi:hypothetical protein